MILYYLYDSAVLFTSKDWNVPMWTHHLSAIALYSTFLHVRLGYGGAMFVLFSEALVPFGASLFYMKLTERTVNNPVFKAITVCGFCVILGRTTLWMYMGYLSFMARKQVPAWFFAMVCAACITGWSLEWVWGNLYLTNIKEAWTKKQHVDMIRSTPMR
jgi:hypothetical protein